MQHVPGNIRPGDGVGGPNERWVRNRAERLAEFGAVGDVPMGGEEDSSQAVGIREVAVGGFGRVYGAGIVTLVGS